MAAVTQENRDQLQTIVEDTWVKASLSSDWDTVTALCTEDIDYMPADTPLVHGRNELKEFLEAFPQMVEFSQTLVNATGDSSLCAWHGTMAVSFVVDGQKMTGAGKVLATATKQDGKWLFSTICFNWDAPQADGPEEFAPPPNLRSAPTHTPCQTGRVVKHERGWRQPVGTHQRVERHLL